MSDLPTRGLPALAEEINLEHQRAEGALNSALYHARTAGALLIQAKKQVRHGGWTAWLQANFRGSGRTAQAYMRLANRWKQIEAKAQSSADLSIDGALTLIAEPLAQKRQRVAQVPLQTAVEVQRTFSEPPTVNDDDPDPKNALWEEIELTWCRTSTKRPGEPGPIIASPYDPCWERIERILKDCYASLNVRHIQRIQHPQSVLHRLIDATMGGILIAIDDQRLARYVRPHQTPREEFLASFEPMIMASAKALPPPRKQDPAEIDTKLKADPWAATLYEQIPDEDRQAFLLEVQRNSLRSNEDSIREIVHSLTAYFDLNRWWWLLQRLGCEVGC